MLKIILYIFLLSFELGAVLYGLIVLSSVFANRNYTNNIWQWTSLVILVIAVAIFFRAKIESRFKLRKFRWQGTVTRAVILGVFGIALVVIDVIQDRSHIVRIYQDIPIYSEPESGSKQIGALPARSKVKVLKIKYNKDSMAIKVESGGKEAWLINDKGVEIYDLDQWAVPLEQAKADFESVSAGYKPIYSKLDPKNGPLADGGTTFYVGERYHLEIRQAFEEGTDGIMYGPIITFDKEYMDYNPEAKPMSNLRLLTVDKLKRLLEE